MACMFALMNIAMNETLLELELQVWSQDAFCI